MGSDFDGCVPPAQIGSAAGLPVLYDALRRHGYDETLLQKIGRDCRKIGGQAAIAIGGQGSLAGWNLCPKPEPSVPL